MWCSFLLLTLALLIKGIHVQNFLYLQFLSGESTNCVQSHLVDAHGFILSHSVMYPLLEQCLKGAATCLSKMLKFVSVYGSFLMFSFIFLNYNSIHLSLTKITSSFLIFNQIASLHLNSLITMRFIKVTSSVTFDITLKFLLLLLLLLNFLLLLLLL